MTYHYEKVAHSVLACKDGRPFNHVGLCVSKIDGSKISTLDLENLFSVKFTDYTMVEDDTLGNSVDKIVIQLDKGKDDINFVKIQNLDDFGKDDSGKTREVRRQKIKAPIFKILNFDNCYQEMIERKYVIGYMDCDKFLNYLIMGRKSAINSQVAALAIALSSLYPLIMLLLEPQFIYKIISIIFISVNIIIIYCFQYKKWPIWKSLNES